MDVNEVVAHDQPVVWYEMKHLDEETILLKIENLEGERYYDFTLQTNQKTFSATKKISGMHYIDFLCNNATYFT